MNLDWHGVYPAITTPFRTDGSVDLDFMSEHAQWMIDAGCRGIVALGSLGEGGTLDSTERTEVLKTLSSALQGRAPLVAAIAATSTREAVRQAQEAEAVGCQGLMVLPPYLYRGRPDELAAHFQEVMGSSTGTTPCMLYNNPPAYHIDTTPEQLADLAARLPRLVAIKESSCDVRRITAIRIAAPHVNVLVGADDLIVEGVQAGAVGWIAGLVNAFPRESVRLFELATRVRESGHDLRPDLSALQAWFLPLLRLDLEPEFVQLIKRVQELVGHGSATVRPPRHKLLPARDLQIRKFVTAALASIPYAGAE